MKKHTPNVSQTPIPLVPDAPGLTLPHITRVSAGFASPAMDYSEELVGLYDYLVSNPRATYLFTVQGDSMIGAGIVDGDKVVVDHSVEARHDDIVLAQVNNEFTLKRLYRRDGVTELRPENPAYPTITFKEGDELRGQGSVAGAVHVFAHTNRFKEGSPQFNGARTMPLMEATDDTRHLTAAAHRVLESFYRAGFQYKKVGVMLALIEAKNETQRTLFDNDAAKEKSAQLMAALDAINNKFGRDTMTTAAVGFQHRWATKAAMRSPRYTTRWDELPVVR
jgi:hypothetical protein